MEWYPRSAWTDVPRPTARLTPLDPAQVRGLAVHYTGSKTPLGARATLQLSARRLEDERVFHTAPPPQGRGWSDLAYGTAIDVEGRVLDCRGVAYRSAANGDATVNQQYGAVTWLIGVGDQPTPAMVAAFREWRAKVWLPAFPRATAVVGHRDLYSTDCPGDPAYHLIQSGALLKQEADVPLTDEEVEAIAVRTRDKILKATYGADAAGKPFTLAALLGEVRVNAARAASVADGLDIVLGKLASGSQVTLSGDQVAAIGAAAAAAMPPGSTGDPALFARAVLVEFGRIVAGA